ncbi:hypothetical protein [Leptospira interrogans]|nr:hypothetical protein [Leptospira interrogans]
MEIEKRKIKFKINKNRIFECEMTLTELDDTDLVDIKFVIDNQNFHFTNHDYFSTLVEVRRKLETMNIQIYCNGAARNVYPSNIQRSMGTGRTAYQLYLGEQAKSKDIVDIFDCNNHLEFATVDEQEKFYRDWISSLA